MWLFGQILYNEANWFGKVDLNEHILKNENKSFKKSLVIDRDNISAIHIRALHQRLVTIRSTTIYGTDHDVLLCN